MVWTKPVGKQRSFLLGVLYGALKNVGFDKVSSNVNQSTVRFTHNGVEYQIKLEESLNAELAI